MSTIIFEVCHLRIYPSIFFSFLANLLFTQQVLVIWCILFEVWNFQNCQSFYIQVLLQISYTHNVHQVLATCIILVSITQLFIMLEVQQIFLLSQMLLHNCLWFFLGYGTVIIVCKLQISTLILWFNFYNNRMPSSLNTHDPFMTIIETPFEPNIVAQCRSNYLI
jgi:hypothetical protein